MRVRSLASVAVLAFAVMGCSHQAPMSSAQVATEKVGLGPLLHEVLQQRDKPGVVVAARVYDLDTKEELYAENLDRPMTPASNLKLFTTAATLDRLGPEHTFNTYLAMDGDDLWVIGTGDPSLGDPKIAKKKHESQ